MQDICPKCKAVKDSSQFLQKLPKHMFKHVPKRYKHCFQCRTEFNSKSVLMQKTQEYKDYLYGKLTYRERFENKTNKLQK